MTRSLKVLGVSLVAMLALGVSGASGAEFTASEYPVTVKDSQVELEYELNGFAFGCSETTFESKLEGPAAEIEATPVFGSFCFMKGWPMTVTHNGCVYQFTIGSGSKDDWSGDLHLVCPKGVKGIEFHVYANATQHANKQSLCTYVEHPQTIGNIEYHNDTPTHVEISFESPVVTTRIAGSIIICGAGTQTAMYRGSISFQAQNWKEEMVALDVG